MDIRRVVGANVKAYRIRAGLSQEELAARMDVEQGYVSRLEAGSRNPTIVTVEQVAGALNVPAAALFELPMQPTTAGRKPRPRARPR